MCEVMGGTTEQLQVIHQCVCENRRFGGLSIKVQDQMSVYLPSGAVATYSINFCIGDSPYGLLYLIDAFRVTLLLLPYILPGKE